MFQSGDYIVYGNQGVCKVAEVGSPNIDGVIKNKLYYKLLPVYTSETIYIPVDTTVFMRPILSRKQAEALVMQIPFIRENMYKKCNLSLLKEHYESAFRTHTCEDLIQLIKGIYTKSVDASQNGKKIGQLDQRYMKRAEDLLYGELSVSLDIPREKVVPYIEKVAVTM